MPDVWTYLSIGLGLIGIGLALYALVSGRLFEKYGPIVVNFSRHRVDTDVGVDAAYFAEVRNRTLAPRTLKFELQPASSHYVFEADDMPIKPLDVQHDNASLANNEYELPPRRTATFILAMRGKKEGSCRVRLKVIDADRYWKEYPTEWFDITVSPTFTHDFLDYEPLAIRLYGQVGLDPHHPGPGRIVLHPEGETPGKDS